ncbi:ribosome rescue GTPase HflX [Wohlfahrtiimonas chitiniclastica]|uniref:ribosome rescue GTPase HflX n=1 Tax=Wohlfahrtiimonas chitiniclastica TaxID=400946 RepID=UPI001BCB45AE|nr:ribosome rescue GTPase HflX [Wohlfahrtiimonas chitiniclastica]MBS7835759.1 GTPase HflX [Wohlfahrtiimonas chitiniclastica]
MFENESQTRSGDQAVLVSLQTQDAHAEEIVEFQELVKAADVSELTLIKGKLATPNQKYFLGLGKVEEVLEAVNALEANVVIVNHELSPSQNRNLERFLKVRVVDRTALILDIFAQRAESFEGKLQVELAQLTHISSRLVRMWTHLDSLRGGSVGLRGPGESQLEMDKRMIGLRIKQLKRKLEKVQQTRAQGQALRNRLGVPVVALVGYTNAGKSSLFNRLTDAGTYVEDKLFATLDPKHRTLFLENIGDVVLIDTVGFISKLPHELVTAFHSTLQSAADADLLLEVIDAGDPEREFKSEQVANVLVDIGAEAVPRIQVNNKIDLLENVEPHVIYNDEQQPSAVWISAEKYLGIQALKDAIGDYFKDQHVTKNVVLPPSQGRLRAKLFALNAVKNESVNEQGEFEMALLMHKAEWDRLLKHDVDAQKYLN